MQIKYVGPSGCGVEISETGQLAERDVPVEVTDEVARGLLQQETNWVEVKPSVKADK